MRDKIIENNLIELFETGISFESEEIIFLQIGIRERPEDEVDFDEYVYVTSLL